MTGDQNNSILYLNRHDVVQTCDGLDSVAAIREMFCMHATGQTILPDEAYLGWKNADGENVRSLNMPGYLGGSVQFAGTKIINANNDNPARGLPRASGLTHLFDSISGRVLCIMESAYISSLRTASVSLLAAETFQEREIACASFIGAGVQTQAHMELLLKRRALYPSLRQIILFDLVEERAAALHQRLKPVLEATNIDFSLASSAEEAVRQGQLVVTATTTTVGYVPFDWLQPGTIFINVSLDDPLPEVALKADKVVVDDWMLVKHDPRRLLGRMYRAGQIFAEDTEEHSPTARRIDAQLGEILIGEKVGRENTDDIILVNPFGLAIGDIAIASVVYRHARQQNLGTWLVR